MQPSPGLWCRVPCVCDVTRARLFPRNYHVGLLVDLHGLFNV